MLFSTRVIRKIHRNVKSTPLYISVSKEKNPQTANQDTQWLMVILLLSCTSKSPAIFQNLNMPITLVQNLQCLVLIIHWKSLLNKIFKAYLFICLLLFLTIMRKEHKFESVMRETWEGLQGGKGKGNNVIIF